MKMKNDILKCLIVIMAGAVMVMMIFAACSKQESSGQNNDAQDAAPQTEEPQAADTDYSIDYLVLVNGSSKLPDTWEDELQLVTITNSVGDEVQTEKNAYEAYLKLKDDLESDPELAARDFTLELDSAFRSVAAQQKIVEDFTEKYGEEYTKKYVAVPGYSEHHTGLALDLYFEIDGKQIYENEDLVQYTDVWDKIHAKLPEYGFILRYTKDGEERTGYSYEPWHIRYVGSPEIAKEITDQGLVLEEYLAKQ